MSFSCYNISCAGQIWIKQSMSEWSCCSLWRFHAPTLLQNPNSGVKFLTNSLTPFHGMYVFLMPYSKNKEDENFQVSTSCLNTSSWFLEIKLLTFVRIELSYSPSPIWPRQWLFSNEKSMLIVMDWWDSSGKMCHWFEMSL